MKALLALVLVAGVAGSARAESRIPKRFWLGATTALAISSEPSEFSADSTTLGLDFGAGVDIGIQHIKGGMAYSLDGDLMPVSNIYRGRASVVLGYGFTMKYRLPCAAPPGMSCVAIYNHRDVRSIFGIKLGAEAVSAPKGETFALEAGLAFRSQVSFDMSFLYDPERSAPGIVMDFTWQLGPFYWGMENRALFSKDEPVAAICSFVLGYTPRMWGKHEN